MLRVCIKASFFFSFLFILYFIMLLFFESMPYWQEYGLMGLFEEEWFAPKGKYGLASMLFGTCIVLCLCVLITFPLALSSAIVISEFLPKKYRLIVKTGVELLAGVPGIIYGLLGFTLFSIYNKELFDLVSGNTLSLAGFTLAVLSLPSLISFLDDVFQDVSQQYRLQSYSLGISKLRTILFVVLPLSFKNICSFSFLVFGRAMGDTIAVMLVVGSIDKIPKPWYNVFSSGQTFSSKLGREATEAYGTGMHWSALMAGALVLLISVVGFTIFGVYLQKMKKKYSLLKS